MEQGSVEGRTLYCGFNGLFGFESSSSDKNLSTLNFGQSGKQGDIKSRITEFTNLNLPNENVVIWAAFFSAAVFRDNDRLFHCGFCRGDKSPRRREIAVDEEVSSLRSPFGDLDGFRGAVTHDGRLLFLTDDAGSDNLHLRRDESIIETLEQKCGTRVQFQAIAIAGNDEICVAVTERHQPSRFLVHVFSDLTAMRNASPPQASHLVPSPVISLQAGATAFVLLLEDHSVWTFGSPLQSALLARSPRPEAPAQSPCLVDALGGVKIAKVAVCDWYGAALSADRDLYIWGGRAGEPQKVKSLSTTEEDVTLVEIGDGADIADIAVGMDHMLLATTDGEVWTCGDNEHGQLGLGDSASGFISEWTKVTLHCCDNCATSLRAAGWGSWLSVQGPG